MTNEEVIRNGGGSPQARAHDNRDCPICNARDCDEDMPIECRGCDEKISPNNKPTYDLGYCDRCKEEIDAMTKRKVKIVVKGGVAEVVSCPPDVEVEIDDQDGQQ